MNGTPPLQHKRIALKSPGRRVLRRYWETGLIHLNTGFNCSCKE